MASGKLRAAYCHVLPSLSQLKQEDHSVEKHREGQEYVSNYLLEQVCHAIDNILFYNRGLKNVGDTSLDSKGNVAHIEQWIGDVTWRNPLLALDGETRPQQSESVRVAQKKLIVTCM